MVNVNPNGVRQAMPLPRFAGLDDDYPGGHMALMAGGMVRRMTWITSGVNKGYRAAWSVPNGRWPRPRPR